MKPNGLTTSTLNGIDLQHDQARVLYEGLVPKPRLIKTIEYKFTSDYNYVGISSDDTDLMIYRLFINDVFESLDLISES